MISWLKWKKTQWHLWCGKKDLWSSHSQFDKADVTVTSVVRNNAGYEAITMHTSDPVLYKAINDAVENRDKQGEDEDD